MLSVERYAWSCEKLVEAVSLCERDRGFSYLPLAHITERVYIYGGSLLAPPSPSPNPSIPSSRTSSAAVPPSSSRCRGCGPCSASRSTRSCPRRKLALLLKIPFVSGLIKSKLQKGLGLDQARVLGCGSAPVAPALLEWYHSIGIEITEAWGMTENHAFSTLNYPFRADKIGTVGKAGPG
jgi:long-chain acyl-CoA synthetase